MGYKKLSNGTKLNHSPAPERGLSQTKGNNNMTDNISKAAAAMGSKGGKASTTAKSQAAKKRANLGLAEGRKKLASLTPEQRRENARKAAQARWKK
jgi:hypothetical protein